MIQALFGYLVVLLSRVEAASHQGLTVERPLPPLVLKVLDYLYSHYQESQSLDSLVAQELEDEENDEILLLDGTELDLDQVVTEAFVLAMDTKNLCSDDCKGLCAKCGANLNDGPCGCRPEVDPRLAVLAQLLDNKTE